MLRYVQYAFENKSPWILVGALFMAIASWMTSLPTSATALSDLSFQDVGSLIFGIGSVIVAWASGKSLPQKVGD